MIVDIEKRLLAVYAHIVKRDEHHDVGEEIMRRGIIANCRDMMLATPDQLLDVTTMLIISYLSLCARVGSPVLRSADNASSRADKPESWHMHKIIEASQLDVPGSKAPSVWAHIMAITGSDLKAEFKAIEDEILDFEAAHGQG